MFTILPFQIIPSWCVFISNSISNLRIFEKALDYFVIYKYTGFIVYDISFSLESTQRSIFNEENIHGTTKLAMIDVVRL